MFSKIFENYISQKNLYFLILFILILIFLCKNVDIAIMLFVSIIFACSLNPIVDKLEKKMNRAMATTLVLVGLILVFSVFVLPILYLSVYEIASFTNEFPTYVNNLNAIIHKVPLLQTLGITDINTPIMDTLSSSSSTIFNSVVSFIESISSAFLYIFTSLIFLFFFLLDNKKIKKNMLMLFPQEYREKTEIIIKHVGKKLSGYVVAQTLVSGSVWITMTIGLLLLNINYAALLGLIAGILSLIPVVGSAISLIICLIVTFESGIKALIFVTVLFTISHFIENHVVRPYVYSKFLKMHQVIVFLALFIGAKYQGVLGVILAPPFAMALCILLQELYIKKMNEQ